jgi:hypothetical protein
MLPLKKMLMLRNDAPPEKRRMMEINRLLTNIDDAIWNGEGKQKSKASAPRMARFEPSGMILRRLYDLLVLTAIEQLSAISD